MFTFILKDYLHLFTWKAAQGRIKVDFKTPKYSDKPLFMSMTLPSKMGKTLRQLTHLFVAAQVLPTWRGGNAF